MYNFPSQEHVDGPYNNITQEHKDKDNDDNNDVVINTLNILANVQLAKTVSKWIYIHGYLIEYVQSN